MLWPDFGRSDTHGELALGAVDLCSLSLSLNFLPVLPMLTEGQSLQGMW